MNRVLLIGFDGASFDKIKALTAKGELPTFADFIEDGCTGTMATTVPPVSSVAWTSLATGVNPGKHGVFYFITPDGHVVLSDKIAGKTIWDVVGKSGKKVILLNMPMTYPPYAINGIMVSGFPCPSNSLSVYPHKLITKLNEGVPGYQVDTPYIKRQYAGMDKDKFYRELCNITEKRLNMSLYLMKEYAWAFFAVVFTSLDRIQHVFWDDQPDYVSQYYKLLDKALQALDQTSKDAVTFVVSDHGFEVFNRIFGINNWLEEQGFLKPAKVKSRRKTYNFLFNLRRTLPLEIRRRIPLSFRKKTRLPTIDFSKTVAHSPFQGAIIVQAPYRERVKEALSKLGFVERVYQKEEVYKGPHTKEAPDLLLALKEGYESRPWAKDITEVVKKPRKDKSCKTGTHQGLSAQKALFMVKGKPVKKGYANPNIIDIAPTILKLMGVKIPSRMEGKVLDIFDS